jgi:hypothetical protein
MHVGARGPQAGREGAAAPRHPRAQLGRPGRGLQHRGRRAAEVEVLEHEQPAGPERRRQPVDDIRPVGQVLDHHPRVDEVVGARLERVAGHVVLEHLDAGHPVQEPRVEVGRGHPAVGLDRAGEPARDRAGAGADLEAAPAGTDPDGGEVPYGDPVEHGRDPAEPRPLDVLGVVEEVMGRLLGHAAPPANVVAARSHRPRRPATNRTELCPEGRGL